MRNQRVTSENPTKSLSAERLREVLDFNPATGQFTWRVSRGCVPAGAVAGCDNGKGLTAINIDRQRHPAARLAFLWMLGRWPEGIVRHRNGDPTDIRWDNLEDTPMREHVRRLGPPATNSSGVKGVSWHATSRRWRAYIRANGRQLSLGYHDTLREAAAARRRGEYMYWVS